LIDSKFLLTDEQMRTFISEGFLILNTDFSQEFHDKMLQKLNGVYNEEGNPGNNLLPRVPELQKVFDHPSIKGALTSVLGEEYIMHPHRHGHYNKVPKPGGWHKDSFWGYDRIRNHHPWWAMIFYYPQDVPVEKGPTGVLPGTQNYQNRNFESDETEDQVKAAGKAGTFVLVHYDIWHRANANLIGKDRFMLKFQFVRTQSPTEPSWNNQEEDWVTPTEFTTSVHSHEVMWRETWNWLHGKIGPDENAASNTESTDTRHWIEELHHPDNMVRVNAADKLALLAPTEEDEIVSALRKALEDEFEPVALNAAYGLANFGEKGVNELINALYSPFKQASRTAGYGLSVAGVKAVQPLTGILNNDNKTAVAKAVFALGELRELAEEAVPALAELLNDEDVLVRRQVVEALGTIGTPYQEVTAALERGLKDEDTQVRFMSGLSITRIGPNAENTIPALVAALEDENRYVRANAVEALHSIGTKEATDTLITYLKSSRWCPNTTPQSTFYP
jgi:HEAT repeat protein